MIAQSISPILPLYVRALGQRDNLIFVSGMIVSAMGVSSMLFSGWMENSETESEITGSY